MVMASERYLPLLHAVFTCFIVIPFLVQVCMCAEDSAKDKWKKKDVRDYTDADLERLFEQWEDADEPLEEDELPEWKRPQPKIDLSKLNANDPEAMLKMTKKGKTLMMFATVSGNPKEKETEQITQLWQSSLFNANIEVQRYVVGSNRVLFMLNDGSMAWDVKDYLVQQDRCEVVTIEGQDFPGKGGTGKQDRTTKKPDSDKNKIQKKQKKRDPGENETVKPNNSANKPRKEEL